MRALLAAMQGNAALGAFAFPVRIGRKRGGAVEAACRNYALEQARETRAGDIQWGTGARGLRPVGGATVAGVTIAGIPVGGVHIAPLSVLTVVVHVSNRLLDLVCSRRGTGHA